jgi:alpha-galactosidase
MLFVALKDARTGHLEISPLLKGMRFSLLFATLCAFGAGALPVTAQESHAGPISFPPTLTPPSPATPEIHGAKLIGTTWEHPFLYTIAATGQRPMTFSADHLPDGLKLDAATGQITGTMQPTTDYLNWDLGRHVQGDPPYTAEVNVTLHAHNDLGDTTRPLKIVIGKGIALTPPMGWNSWNCFAGSVTQVKVEAAADAMVSSGLAQHGWTYVNVDDFWQVNPGSQDPTLHGPERDAAGNVLSNPRFPNMKAMADHIHALGLKAGLYSSPGPLTCGGCIGSYQHEEQDARQYAAWGFDYLKYDWCSYDRIYDKAAGVSAFMKPYVQMHDALSKANRDIVFSFCQYGMGDVWKWGAAAGGNSWRTTGDIRDTWASMSKKGSRGIGLSSYAGPGHWNDPDMLVVGVVGWDNDAHPTHLTADEQYFHISMWALQGAPLLIGCDLTKLDPFTLGLLTNDEVIDVDQDPLGKVADVVGSHEPNTPTSPVQAWSRPMEDGSLAVGLFNYADAEKQRSITWRDLGISGPHTVRDLWRQKDLGIFTDEFTATVPAHGVVLVRVIKSSQAPH